MLGFVSLQAATTCQGERETLLQLKGNGIKYNKHKNNNKK